MNTDASEPAASPEMAGLAAEADAALAGAPEGDALTDAATGGEVVQDAGEPWEPFLMNLKPLLFGFVLPQWEVTEPEQMEWTRSLAACCDQLFPGGPEGKYACYVRLIAATAAITATRMVQNGGKVPPLGPKRLPKPASDGAQASA